MVHMLSRHFLFLSAQLLPAIVHQPCQCQLTIMLFFFFKHINDLKIVSEIRTMTIDKNSDLCSVVHQHQNRFPA